MNIKILFLDLDGTVLDSNENVSADNISAIKKAKDAGVVTVISTGRAQFESQYVIDMVQPDFFSGMNGSVIRDLSTDKIIFQRVLDINIAKEVTRLMESLDMYYMACTHSGTYCLPQTLNALRSGDLHFSKGYMSRFGEFLKPLESIEETKPAKFFTMAKDSKVALEFQEQLRSIDGIFAAPTLGNGFDVLPKDQHKAVSAKMLCDRLGIDAKDSAAIGDSENDLELMNFVGYSVAMENSFERIKQISRYHTYSNDDNGVAHAINNILKI